MCPGNSKLFKMLCETNAPSLHSKNAAFNNVGGDTSNLSNIDGLDMWSSLSGDTASPRNLMLHNIDETRYGQVVKKILIHTDF